MMDEMFIDKEDFSRILDVIISCKECNYTVSKERFSINELKKFSCDMCSKKSFRVLLPFRSNKELTYFRKYISNEIVNHDPSIMDKYKNGSQMLESDFKCHIEPWDGFNEPLLYASEKSLVLYADTHFKCTRHKRLLVPIDEYNFLLEDYEKFKKLDRLRIYSTDCSRCSELERVMEKARALEDPIYDEIDPADY